MLKDFYNAIQTRLGSLVTPSTIPDADPIQVIKQKGYWNEQWAFEKENKALVFPCVFVEFTSFPFEQLGNKVQQANAVIKLHVGSRCMDYENLNHLDLVEAVNVVMTGFQGENFGTWTRTGLDIDHNHDSLIAHVLTYRVRIQDNTAVRPLIAVAGDKFLLQIELL